MGMVASVARGDGPERIMSRLFRGLAGGVYMLLASVTVFASTGERVEVCFNYGCAERTPIFVATEDFERLAAKFQDIGGPEEEREAIARAVAALFEVAGGQTPVFADRRGNLLDAGVEGRMDCIDHSTTTTGFLRLLEDRGWLRHHTVGTPARRTNWVLQHFSAVIEAREPAPAGGRPGHGDWPDHVGLLLVLCDCPEVVYDGVVVDEVVDDDDARPPGPVRFAVDSWFVDHGEPAVILPLADWYRGEGPNVQ